ncbi:MAG: hypothetical protein ACTHMU_04520 [Thermomicrobiales bacterium]
MNSLGQVTVPPVVDVTTLINALVGIFLPLAIAWVRSQWATSKFAAWFAFAICLVVSLLITFVMKGFQGTWQLPWGAHWQDNLILVIVNVGALLLTAWNFYSRLWKPVGVTDTLERLRPQVGNPQRNTGGH